MKNILAKTSQILLAVIIVFTPLFGLPKPLLASDILISNIQVEQSFASNNQSVKAEISWNSNIATYGQLYFGTSRDNLPLVAKTSGEAKTKSTLTVFNLESEVTYYFKVESYIGTSKTESFIRSFEVEEFDETIAPEISDVSVDVTGTAATISWITNEKASGRVFYGTKESDLRSSVSHGDLKYTHQLTISNLRPQTNYFYQVTSKDKQGNESKWYVDNFKTTGNSEENELEIKNLEPTSLNSNLVGINDVTIKFSTTNLAESDLWIKPYNGGSTTKHESNMKQFLHEYSIVGLAPNTTYLVTIEVKDIYGNTEKIENFTVATKAVAEEGRDITTSFVSSLDFSLATRLIKTPDRDTVYAVIDPNADQTLVSKRTNTGWYARYYDHSDSHPEFNSSHRSKAESPFVYDWYDNKYLVKTTVDEDIANLRNFFPLDSFDKEGMQHNYLFTVHWTGYVDIPETDEYKYTLYSDDDSWLYIDDQQVYNNSGRHGYEGGTKRINLTAGLHKIDIYYAERHPTGADMHFEWNDERLNVKPFSGIKTKTTGRVQLHPIMNPGAFLAYGYSWEDIEIVDQSEINSFIKADLIRTPNDPTVYWLDHQRRTKVAIPNETIFNSYNFNWDDIIVVNDDDLNAFYDLTVVKSNDSNIVYYVEDNTKRAFLSEEVFHQLGYDFDQVVTLNRTHLDYLRLGENINTNNVRYVTN